MKHSYLITIDERRAKALLSVATHARAIIEEVAVEPDGNVAYLERVREYYESDLAHNPSVERSGRKLIDWSELPHESRLELGSLLAEMPQWLFPDQGIGSLNDIIVDGDLLTAITTEEDADEL